MKKIFSILFLLISLTSIGQQTSPGSKTGDTTLIKGFARMPDIPAGVGTREVRVDASGKFFSTDTTILVAFGTYTPTITNGVNMAASTAYVMNWMRVGNTATVWGQMDLDPTATSTNTTAEFSLPIASDFTAIGDCTGMGGVSYSITGVISGLITNNRGIIQYLPTDAANAIWYLHFSYTIK